MSVERFEPSGGGGQGAAYYEMDKASDGEWVRFEDYEKLHKELDTLSTRFTALIQQNNTLAAENERLSEKLAAMENQKPDCWRITHRSFCGIVTDKKEIAEDPFYSGCVFPLYAEPMPADKPERITDQDAMAILLEWDAYRAERSASGVTPAHFKKWLNLAGRDLLNKLNADREQAPPHSQQSDGGDCAVAAIEYAIDTEEGLDFLRYWFYGEFDVLRRNWDNIPDRVFIGADTLFNSDRCPSHESEQGVCNE